MPGGGTPALAPMKLPAFVMEPKPASFAYAGENANAAIPAAASRALLFIFMYPPCGSLKIALPVSQWFFRRVLQNCTHRQSGSIGAEISLNRCSLITFLCSRGLSRDTFQIAGTHPRLGG